MYFAFRVCSTNDVIAKIEFAQRCHKSIIPVEFLKNKCVKHKEIWLRFNSNEYPFHATVDYETYATIGYPLDGETTPEVLLKTLGESEVFFKDYHPKNEEKLRLLF